MIVGMHFASLISVLMLGLTVRNIVCSSDCADLSQCIENKGGNMDNTTFDLQNQQQLLKYLKTICVNATRVMECLPEVNATHCPPVRSMLIHKAGFQSAQPDEEDIDFACKKQSDFAKFVSCTGKPDYIQEIEECSNKNKDYKFKDGSTIVPEIFCPSMFEYSKCVVDLTRQNCTDSDASFFKDQIDEEFLELCGISSSVTMNFSFMVISLALYLYLLIMKQ